MPLLMVGRLKADGGGWGYNKYVLLELTNKSNNII